MSVPQGPYRTNVKDLNGNVIGTKVTFNAIIDGAAIHHANVKSGNASHVVGEKIPALTYMLLEDVPILTETSHTTGEEIVTPFENAPEPVPEPATEPATEPAP
jgi:hypothetical protein